MAPGHASGFYWMGDPSVNITNLPISQVSPEVEGCLGSVCVGTLANIQFPDEVWTNVTILHLFKNRTVGFQKGGVNYTVPIEQVKVKTFRAMP